ncbi:hypothetical protein PaecuDRAFT_3570 [Paenibacillus curdlanolyticus YK9]|uniref:Uncharacterized protein n=1 Tax=Paenibacillus curdlanolyticus YK9 TaxID=717606 RepID=E0ID68_9BACL|nr:hypothetical protein [Paenibacillus curdlanolyticus]EFM09523.1 hypothetical protein PaecuDRAFT_3570 [Paenibacillus curdlanolyticus YK9]
MKNMQSFIDDHKVQILNGKFNLDNSGKQRDFEIKQYRLYIRECYESHLAHHIVQDYKKFRKELDAYLENNTKPLPKPLCPIYYITTLEKECEGVVAYRSNRISNGKVKCKENSEIPVYVGKTVTNMEEPIGRFSDGHSATQMLTDPKYEGLEKRVYTMQVLVDLDIGTELFQDVPIEFIEPFEIVKDAVEFLESILICFTNQRNISTAKEELFNTTHKNTVKYDNYHYSEIVGNLRTKEGYEDIGIYIYDTPGKSVYPAQMFFKESDSSASHFVIPVKLISQYILKSLGL